MKRSTIDEALSKARARLSRLEKSDHTTEIKSVKLIDVGLRLTAQACVLSLKEQYGMSFTEQAEYLREHGIKGAAHDRIGEYATASQTASPEIVALLYRLYEGKSKSDTLFHRARHDSTAFVD